MSDIDVIDFPESIIDALKENRLVVFGGAGVSIGKPTCMPNFTDLAKMIAKGSYYELKTGEPEDQFLGKLESKGIKVKKKACDILSEQNHEPNKMHESILGLFSKKNIRIITTNYDHMFEKKCEETGLDISKFINPALPMGDNFKGIVKLHGDTSDDNSIIISDYDFGDAYLTRSYVSKFLVDLFKSNYVILFIGYSYDDTVMRYLTRAVQGQVYNANKYILTDDEEQDWNILDIKPIFYRKKDYDTLNEGIKKLGEIANYNYLDWVDRIEYISKMQPKEIDLWNKKEILEIFKNIEYTKQFLKKIKSVDWLKWLYKNELLKNLFSEEIKMKIVDIELSNWICECISNNEEKEFLNIFISFINKNNHIMNCELKNILLWYMCNDDRLAEESFKDLLSVFNLNIAEINENYNYYLLQKVSKYNMEFYMFKIFVNMIEGKKKLKASKNNTYVIKESWKLIRLKLKKYQLEFLERITNIIKEKEYDYKLNNKKSSLGIFIDIVEEPEYIDEDEYCIYILKDLLDIIESIHLPFLKNWILLNLNSENSILRRLSILKLKDLSIFDGEKKIELILDNIGLFQLEVKQEVFLLVAEEFDNLSEEKKDNILDTIFNNYKENIDKLDNASLEQKAYESYNWLVWLKKKCKYNRKIESLINKTKINYDYFEPRKYPEKSAVIEPYIWEANKSPIKKQELLGMKNLEEKYDFLLEYNPKHFFNVPSREGLLDSISEASKESFNFAMQIINLMIENEHYNIDIWGYVFRGLEKQDLNKGNIDNLIEICSNEKIMSENTEYISSLLLEICKKLSYDDYEYVDSLFEFSKLLWKFKEKSKHDNKDLSINVINSSKGNILISWIIMLNIIFNNKKRFPSEFKKNFIQALKDNKDGYSTFVIVGHFSYFYIYDRSWAYDYLYPYFNSENKETLKSVWQGYLYFSECHIEIEKVLKDNYLYVIGNMDVLTNQYRKLFIKRYTVQMVYNCDEFVHEFIKKIFKYLSDEKEIDIFYDTVNDVLQKNLKENEKIDLWERWLKEYCKNRLYNIPIPVETKELEKMLYWSLNLGEKNNELVDLLYEEKFGNLIQSRFPYELNNSNLVSKDPEIIQKLLLIITRKECKIEENWGKEYVLKVYKKLEDNNIPIKEELGNNIKRIGDTVF